MKIFRSSFNHLIREKVIAGYNDTMPPPEARELASFFTKISDHKGTFEYDNQDRVATIAGKTFNSQGPMGYGDPPIGTGSTPYYSFLSNKVIPSDSSDLFNNGIVYTGNASIVPEIVFKDMSYKGIHATFALGLASHYATSGSTVYHAYAPEKEHVIAAIYGIKDTEADGEDKLSNGCLQFCYKNSKDGGKGYEIYINYKLSGSNSVDEQLKETGTHFYLPYGRLTPVTVSLNSLTGDIIFKLDNKEIITNMSQLVDSTGDPLVAPTSGTLGLKVRGLSCTGYALAFAGLDGPISRLTNLAVNDGDNSDTLGDHSVPPFIVGIPCTGVRAGANNDHLPLQVSGTGWMPFSDSSDDFGYDHDLQAIADVQMLETRGVAASAIDEDLEIYTTNTDILSSELSTRGLPSLSGVEAINTIIFGATVMDSANDLKLKIINNSPGTLTTNQQAFADIKTDFNDSHLTFFQKSDNSDLVLDDFINGMVFVLEVAAI